VGGDVGHGLGLVDELRSGLSIGLTHKGQASA
jgi:hypothetical protein